MAVGESVQGVSRGSISTVLKMLPILGSMTLLACSWCGYGLSVAEAQAEVRVGSAASVAGLGVGAEAGGRVRLRGNVPAQTATGTDLGEVDDGVRLDHMLVLLQPLAERRAALDAFLANVTDPDSGEYHRWVTPEEFGRRFGAESAQIRAVSEWLLSQGFTVHGVYPNRMLLDFSGTAGEVRRAFWTEVHAFDLGRERHVANVSDPAVPAELAGTVLGIVSLHDFAPRGLSERRPRAEFNSGSGAGQTHPVTPADLATIYNLTPLHKAGYTGKGQTIAILTDSDVYSSANWVAFRSAFGLSGFTSGTLKLLHPAARGGAACGDPGVVAGRDEEPILDAEYATGSAPGATVEVASCAATKATSGVMLALMNLVNSASLPNVLSVSYGSCEAANGAAANAAIAAAYAQAAAEGISVFAAAGDAGGAFCDTGGTVAVHGIGVNAYASTPNNVAVGGTDFADTYTGTTGLYWNTTNSASGGSAKSYVPEMPWDDSCGSPDLANWNGFSATYGPLGFCAWDYVTYDNYQTVAAGSGGPSGCATGSPATAFVTDGSCRGYAKPGWQAVLGNPKDGVRDLPDLALFAADGVWGHALIYCNSNPNDLDGAPCPTNGVAGWSAGGGTSFAAPLMAGIQALVNQKWGNQGNPNAVYYKLAGAQFNSTMLRGACASSRGAATGSSCLFHDVNQGASAVNCQGALSCFGSVLSTSTGAFAAAFNAGTGWDFATGLGSVNAYNLVMGW